MRGVAILGSTGSVGTQTLDVLAGLEDRFRVIGLAAGRNLTLLERQIDRFHPLLVCCERESDRSALGAAAASYGARTADLVEIAAHPEVEILVVASAGTAGLVATLVALESGKIVALANKEILVIAGSELTAAAERGGGELRPVDSEHSAIWQCLWGEQGTPKRLILTASGGAFRDRSIDDLRRVSPEEALRHPTWQMGRKITVDSATLLNKGLETIEARWLFGVPLPKIEVVLHRQSIVHSLVEFADGSVKAQLGYPDMRLPIQCALSYPERLPLHSAPPLNLAQIGSLTFEAIDSERFPCLSLAMEAGRRGGAYPAVLVAADEVAVEHFLAGRMGFMEIPALLTAVLAEHRDAAAPDLDAILAAGAWARAWAEDWVLAREAPWSRTPA
ncbi:MAG TPA: 1-deoxy-D-xylulose-5-phosphate reductoisomerase [Steroidobacteraceae bacterium]|nr:1-deoxy-D-xylulose-5-phosphate reductoisomerase [Steroidobacteraceae bacterium]